MCSYVCASLRRGYVRLTHAGNRGAESALACYSASLRAPRQVFYSRIPFLLLLFLLAVQIPSMRRCVRRNCRHIVASARLVFDCLCAIRMRVLLVRSPSITVFYFLCFEIRLRRACYAEPSVRHPGRHAPPCAPRRRVSSASRFWVAALCHAVRAILSSFFPAISSSVLLSALLPRSQPRPAAPTCRAREVEKLRPRLLEDALVIFCPRMFGTSRLRVPNMRGRVSQVRLLARVRSFSTS